MTTTARKRLLITGSTGFVGFHVASVVADTDLEVRALVRASSDVRHLQSVGIECVQAELWDVDGLRRAAADADIVLHLAALTRARSEAAFRAVNVEGTRRLVDAVRAGPAKRLVYLSTLAAVGPARDGRPVRPEDEPRPLTAYGRSKLDGERVCLDAGDGLRVVVLRPPAVYGPRDRDLLTFFRLARRGVLPVPTGPERRIQMIYAGDLAEAVVRAALAERAEGIYHTAEPRAYRWRTLVEMVADAVGRPGRTVLVPAALVRTAGILTDAVSGVTRRPSIFGRDKARELLAPGWLCETDAARVDMDFVARTPLREGLRETASWYRAYGWLG